MHNQALMQWGNGSILVAGQKVLAKVTGTDMQGSRASASACIGNLSGTL